GVAELGEVAGNGGRSTGKGIVDVDGGDSGDGDVNGGKHIGCSISHEEHGSHVHGRDDQNIFDANGGDKAAVGAPEARVEGVSLVRLGGSARGAGCLHAV